MTKSKLAWPKANEEDAGGGEMKKVCGRTASSAGLTFTFLEYG
jgi:hypothetical protein